MSFEREQMHNIQYVFGLGRLMYAQVYTRLDIQFSVDARQILEQFKYELLKSYNKSNEEPSNDQKLNAYI